DRVSQPAPEREQPVSVTPPVTRRILERAPLSREERAHALFCCWGERYRAHARHGVLIGDSQVFRHCVLRSGGGADIDHYRGLTLRPQPPTVGRVSTPRERLDHTMADHT